MGDNEKELEELKASRRKSLLMKKILCYSDAWDLYTAQSQAKLQKCMKESLFHEGQFKKNEKYNKEVKKEKSSMNSAIGCEISQPMRNC